MIKVGIIGGSGYTGGELIRLLILHPAVTVDFVYSRTKATEKISHTHSDLLGMSELCFTKHINPNVEVVFLCLGHGYSKAFLEANAFSSQTKIIDLSTDFRQTENREYLGKTFVYGLPEINKSAIKNANYIANPGCFATALQLALLPLASVQKLIEPVHINGTTGSTGAGVVPSDTTHFSWRDNNLSWYKAFEHQHLKEVNEQLTIVALQESLPPLFFIPQRGNFSRGIFATLYTAFNGSLEEAQELYKKFYAQAPFTHISLKPINLKAVVNTNNCQLHLHKYQDQLLITVAIDNLLKGASGQAIQNMNLVLGMEEILGLSLKGSAF